MSELVPLVRRWLRPAAGAIALLSAAAAIILVLALAPEAERGLPIVIQRWVIGVLVTLGVLLPALIALCARRVRASTGALVFFLAGTANSVCLGQPVAVPLQNVLSLLATVLALAMTTVSLIAGADSRRRRPLGSKF